MGSSSTKCSFNPEKQKECQKNYNNFETLPHPQYCLLGLHLSSADEEPEEQDDSQAVFGAPLAAGAGYWNRGETRQDLLSKVGRSF